MTEANLSLMSRDGPQEITLTLSVGSDAFDNDATVVSGSILPLLWILDFWTTEHGDPLILEQYQVFQAPLTTLDAELYEDEQ